MTGERSKGSLALSAVVKDYRPKDNKTPINIPREPVFSSETARLNNELVTPNLRQEANIQGSVHFTTWFFLSLGTF